MAARIVHDYEWAHPTLKSGKPSKRWIVVATFPYCPIRRCGRCGRWGSDCWVKVWDTEPWPPEAERKPNYEREDARVRCLGCFNRLRRLWGTLKTVWENNKLIRKLVTEARRVQAENRR